MNGCRAFHTKVKEVNCKQTNIISYYSYVQSKNNCTKELIYKTGSQSRKTNLRLAQVYLQYSTGNSTQYFVVT